MIVEIGDELIKLIADEINPREDCQVSFLVCVCVFVCAYLFVFVNFLCGLQQILDFDSKFGILANTLLIIAHVQNLNIIAIKISMFLGSC